MGSEREDKDREFHRKIAENMWAEHKAQQKKDNHKKTGTVRKSKPKSDKGYK
jgi:hypothetical protein